MERRKVIVLGDGGSGKSRMLSWIMGRDKQGSRFYFLERLKKLSNLNCVL